LYNNQVSYRFIDSGTIEDFLKNLEKSSKIHGWKFFKSFKFNLAGCDKIKKRGFKALSNFIQKDFANLRNIELNFDLCLSVIDEELSRFGTQLKYSRNIRQIDFSFSGCRNINNKGVKSLQSKLTRNQKSLKQVSLDFSECENIGSKGFNALSSSMVPRLSNLTHLSLDLSDSEDISTKFMKTLGQSLNKYAKSLLCLNLNLSGCSQISDNDLKLFTSQISPALYQLQQLSLYFYRCSKMTDESWEFLHKI